MFEVTINEPVPARYNDMLKVAEVAHEATRAVALLFRKEAPSWAAAPLWQRASCLNGVAYALAHPELLPVDLHNNWLAEKLASGWRYGTEFNEEMRESPLIRPYAEIAPEEKLKEALFLAVVRTAARVFNVTR